MIHTAMNMADDLHCIALSGCFRGKLCEQLMNRPGQPVAKGARIYAHGDSAQSVFYLRQGFMKLTSLTDDGRELILRLQQAGEVFGELCHCTGDRREQAIATEASEIVELGFDEFIAHLQSNPPAVLLFLSNVAQQLWRPTTRFKPSRSVARWSAWCARWVGWPMNSVNRTASGFASPIIWGRMIWLK